MSEFAIRPARISAMSASTPDMSDLSADGTAASRSYDDIELLHSISVELIGEQEIGALYGKILNAAVTIAASQFGSMQFLHSERGPVGGPGELKLLAAHRYSQAEWHQFEWVTPQSKTSCGATLNTRLRTVITDIEQSALMAGSQELDAFRNAGIRSMQSTPLISRTGQLLGMISTHWSEPHEPSKRDLRMMDILARQAADLMERTRADAAMRETESTAGSHGPASRRDSSITPMLSVAPTTSMPFASACRTNTRLGFCSGTLRIA
jgi:GAF domain-containing protein